jgi:hypothetical protein
MANSAQPDAESLDEHPAGVQASPHRLKSTGIADGEAVLQRGKSAF